MRTRVVLVAPLAYLLTCLLGACSFPDVTIIADAECLDDSGCTDGLRCSGQGRCVPCATDDHCAGGLVCGTDGTCIQCRADADCEATGLCDTASHLCVECFDESDCDGEDICAEGACAPSHCANGVFDEPLGEVAEDCGGPCVGCGAGTPCTDAADCQTELCVDEQCSLPCTIKANCSELPGSYCDGEVCRSEKAIGAECFADDECQNGQCSRDGICCDAACEDVCYGCRQKDTGVATGTCAPLLSGTKDTDCPALAPKCNGNGTCVLL